MKSYVVLAVFVIGFVGSNASAMIGRSLRRIVPSICKRTTPLFTQLSTNGVKTGHKRANFSYPFGEVYKTALEVSNNAVAVAASDKPCNDLVVFETVQRVVKTRVACLDVLLNNSQLKADELIDIVLELEFDLSPFFSDGLMTPATCCAREFYTMIISNARVVRFFEKIMPELVQNIDEQQKAALIDSIFLGPIILRSLRNPRS